MFTYQVNDMTCGHCASAITKAVLDIDNGAKVDVDLAQHTVHIESSNAAGEAFRQAIQAAGYEPVAVKPTLVPPVVPRAGGCCCGTGAARCGI
jgi:copper chaperone